MRRHPERAGTLRARDRSAPIALVTGAASGMGRRFAIELGARGCSLVLVDLDRTGLERTAAGLRDARALAADVGSAEAVEALVAGLDVARIDLLVNCAGVLGAGRFAAQGVRRFAEVVRVNLMGAVHMIHATLPLLRRARGHVVNIASTASLHGWPQLAAYSAAKGALENYGEAVRPELAEDGIGLTTVFPLLVDTPMLAGGDVPPILRGRRITAERVVTDTLRAVERRKARLYVPWTAQLVAVAHGLAPPLLDWWGARAGMRGARGARR